MPFASPQSPAAQLQQPLTFGTFTYPDRRVVQLGTRYEDLCRHSHLVGMSGVGKSTLLVNLISATMDHNLGCLLIDPHRDLVADALERVPARREKDVCLVSPFPLRPPATPAPDRQADPIGYAAWLLRQVASDRYPGLNILQAPDPDQSSLVVGQALNVFQKVIGANWESAVRMQRVLAMCLYAMVGWKEDATLEEMYRFLTNEEFREMVLMGEGSRPANRHSKTFWLDEFGSLSQSEQNAVTQPVLTRIQKFLTHDIADRLVNQRQSTIDFETLMAEGKIVLAPVAQALGTELMRFLGTLLVVKLRTAAVSREQVAEDQRPPFPVFIDECHNFIMPDLVQALAEDRKRRLCYFLAHQFLGQLKEGGLLEAVIGNVGTRIIFKVGQDDAAYLARGIAGLEAADVGGLKNFWAYALFLVQAAQQPVCSMQTLPKPPPRTDSLPTAEPWPEPTADISQADLDLVKTLYLQPSPQARLDLLQEKISGEQDWSRFETARRTYDLGLRRKLLELPHLIPDKGERVSILSALKYTRPRFQIDAQLRAADATSAPVDDWSWA